MNLRKGVWLEKAEETFDYRSALKTLRKNKSSNLPHMTFKEVYTSKPVYKKLSNRTSENLRESFGTTDKVSVDKKLISYFCSWNFSNFIYNLKIS